MQVNHGRCRHAISTLDLADAMAERTEIPAALSEKFAGLGEHPGHGRLAVGPGNADDLEVL